MLQKQSMIWGDLVSASSAVLDQLDWKLSLDVVICHDMQIGDF